jgi:hypothetical protein
MTSVEDDDVLSIWTIYERPRDYPDQCVARRFEVRRDGSSGPTNDMFVADTVDELRLLLPHGLFCLTRKPTDDPVIVETWV